MHSTLFTVISGILAIVLLVILITRVKLHPFFALLISSILLGIVNGLDVTTAVSTFTDGFGKQLSVTGVVIALGAMLGGILIRSGGGDRIADVIIGKRKIIWMPISVGLVALIIGLPNLFEVTFVLLVPLVFSIAKRLHVSLLAVGIPMAAGLMTAHGLLPPGPAPILAATAYGANIGTTTLYGVIVAVPVLLVGAWLFPRVMRKYIGKDVGMDPSSPAASAHIGGDLTLARLREPSLAAALSSVLLAPALMIIGTIGLDVTPKGSFLVPFFETIGNPVLSLTFAVILAFIVLGRGSGFTLVDIQAIVRSSIVPIVSLLLIIGAGGGLKTILTAIGLSDIISGAAQTWAIPAVLFAWIVAAIFRIALGSGTVAVSASTGIVAALIAADPSVNPALLVLATCTGAMIFSHVSDGAFWLFKEYFGLTVPQTLRTWSLLVTVQSVVGLGGILVLGAFVGGLA
ncbi:gluconate:H+ symporter [Glaciihabitans sp. dw_435]|uniref:GntT/GntP/DsdX family permease n=1 Tax=Glaciihabitans sp. dw_435 TaxID=2720081 RepID=UPI001BD4E9A6|nr:gluconate:H+ symporter [Glaciihabitans sp. dw_435]